MLQKKVCLLGSFAVGKTSLVSRFVRSIFSEAYHTTVGVKVDDKVVRVGEQELRLVLWDLHGEDQFQRLRSTYLRGAAGLLFVADGTRPRTLETAASLRDDATTAVGSVPHLLLLNKADLTDAWAVDAAGEATLRERGWRVLRTSAKDGSGVEEAFAWLARELVGGADEPPDAGR